MYCENTAAIAIALQPDLNARMKHIKVRMHHIRGLLVNSVICLLDINSEADIADIFTKPVGWTTLLRLRGLIMSWFVLFDDWSVKI